MPSRFRASATSICLASVAATAVAHLVVLLSFNASQQVLASNIVQLIAAVLVTGICVLRMCQSTDPFLRSAWPQLTAGFTIYTAAQSYFAWSLFARGRVPSYPSPSDFLWMMFAFPILLVLVKRRAGNGWLWVDWLDAAQAGTFFSLQYVLVFSHLAAWSVSLAYDLQSAALILAWAIRFSGTTPGPERLFLRNLGWFLGIYGVLSSLGNRWEQLALPAYRWVGLCWSTPLLFFCWLILRTPETTPDQPVPSEVPRFSLPRHLQGLSALGLCVMSLGAAATLESHRPIAGVFAIALAFLIFAVRTSLRESQLHHAHSTLEHAVMHDPLTGLANRTRLVAETRSPPRRRTGRLHRHPLHRSRPLQDHQRQPRPRVRRPPPH